MSNLELVQFKQESIKTAATVANPMVVKFGPYAQDKIVVSVKVATVTGGIAVGSEIVVLLEQSWDDGATWQTVPNIEVKDSSNATVVGPTGVGVFVIKTTSSSGVLSPIARLTLTPPSGQNFTLSGMWKLAAVAY